MQKNQKADAFQDRIKILRRELRAGLKQYDGNAVSFVSNVQLYSRDPAALRRYASSVIPARIMQLYATTWMKTLSLTDLYMAGIERNIVYALPLASRTQLEIFTVVWDVARVIKENAGLNEEKFEIRVQSVDDTLINAVYGARHAFLPNLLRHFGTGTPDRELGEDDIEKLNATNILTRLRRLIKEPEYSKLAEEYEVLCQLTHPNMLQNFLLAQYDEGQPKILRWGYDSSALNRAVKFCSEPMALAAEGALKIINSIEPPFGTGKVIKASEL